MAETEIRLTDQVQDTLAVGNGGTGATTLTGLLKGNGTSAITGGATINNSNWSGTQLAVNHGGTGKTSLTAYGLLAAGTTSTGALQQVSGTGTSGQVLTSNGASALPTWQTASSGSSFTWNTSTSDVTASANNGYIASGSGLRTITLPAGLSVGDTIAIVDPNGNGWKLAQQANVQVILGSSSTTPGTGGSLASTATAGDSVTLVNVGSDVYTATSIIGNITVV